LENGFVDLLAKAKSNLADNGDGRRIYEKFVKPAIVTRDIVGAHYAISSVFESYPNEARLYAFTFKQEERQMFTSGAARLAIGRARVTFEITRSSDILTYGVLYMGSHNLNCWVHLNGQSSAHGPLVEESRAAFERADFSEIIRLMDRHFGPNHYSLKSLFRDEQRKVLNQILAATREEIQTAFKLIADRHSPLLRVLADLNAPTLSGLRMTVESVLNSEIRAQFLGERLDREQVRSLLAECNATKINVEREVLAYACKLHFDRLGERLLGKPADVENLKQFVEEAKVIHDLPFEVNLWKPQNVYFEVSHGFRPEMTRRSKQGDAEAKPWESLFAELGQVLGFSANLGFDETPTVLPKAANPPEPALAAAS